MIGRVSSSGLRGNLLISDEYRALNAELHQREPSYGTSGCKWAEPVYSLAKGMEAKTVLDYGCGKGSLKHSIIERYSVQPMPFSRIPLPFEILEYDPAIADKSAKPLRADFVVCGDVLEHIEPDCLYTVLDDLRNIARLAVFLVVATRPAKKTLSDGRNAHLIIEDGIWWLPKLIERWYPRQFIDRGGEFMFVGTTK